MTGNYATGTPHAYAATAAPWPQVDLRPARWLDAWRIWRWRNHPATRVQMVRTAPIPLLEHVKWFARVRRHPELVRLYVVWHGRRPVGVVRLDKRESMVPGWRDDAVVDVVVAPYERGTGYGERALVALVVEASRLGLGELEATIKAGNTVSRRAFRRAGFQTTDWGSDWVVMRMPVPHDRSKA